MNAMQADNGPLTRDDLWSLEQYDEVRPEFRKKVMEHKRVRIVPVGPNATIHFEDALTMKYQVQEMLRAERIYRAEEIQDELDVYNPLIPTGTNWKATFMLEYPDPKVRLEKTKELVGLEDHIYVRVGEGEKIYAIANEDLERSTPDKTSTVHYLRFELPQEAITQVKAGAPVHVGVDHPKYTHETEVPEETRASLAKDLA
jgi:hypothetical protein